MPTPPYFFGNKPFGVTTLSLSKDKPSYQDWLEDQKQQNLFTVEVLDNDTTGSIVFATSKEDAIAFSSKLKNEGVQKEYLFVTDRPLSQKKWISSPSSAQTQTTNTEFELLNSFKSFSLIAARTQGDSTHIRQLAMENSIPILGDTSYRGTSFPCFFLHCLKTTCPSLEINHTAIPPYPLEHLETLEDPLLCTWLQSVDRRRRLYPELFAKSLRLIHDEGTPLRIDGFDKHAVAGWWAETPPTEKEMSTLHKLFEILKIPEWVLLHYSGQRKEDSLIFDNITNDSWLGNENTLKFEMRKNTGLSCGLFLDQRDNRNWVFKNSDSKTVLNLFAYTGGFSVASALGGAHEVTTVDLHKNYLEWSKTNFLHNSISLDPHFFYAMDSLEFLKYAQRKEKFYDIIICDPPSFSRNKKGDVFRVDKDFNVLIKACLDILNPRGTLVFCTNYEKWSSKEWTVKIQKIFGSEGIEITSKISHQWDFETSYHRHMKTFFLKKK
jgi:23S rRNA (cytosine1962-C5)-methyltransferase